MRYTATQGLDEKKDKEVFKEREWASISGPSTKKRGIQEGKFGRRKEAKRGGIHSGIEQLKRSSICKYLDDSARTREKNGTFSK